MATEIVQAWPPNIAEIRKVLPVTRNNIFAYAGKIYSPGTSRLPQHLIAHEQTHFRQQGDDPDGWWSRFLADPQFRLSQEIEAHRVEWRAFLDANPGRKERRFTLKQMAIRLSAPMYGGIISRKQAAEAIAA